MYGLLKAWMCSLCAILFASLANAQSDDPNLDAQDVIHPAWQSFTPKFVEQICPFPISFKYDTEAFRCGYVLVPEDRTNPQSRLIKLSVLQGDASTPEGKGRALMRLTGGPGGESLSSGRILAYDNGIAAKIREAADVIFFDQRGTGYSEGNICRAIPLPYQYGVRSTPDGLDKFKADIAACFETAERRGISLEGYTNWQNALDVRDIRIALGYDTWTLFGISYGTELAQAAIMVDPVGVDAAILDSIVPLGYPTNDLKAMFASGFMSALNGVSAMCAADKGCAAKYDDLGARFIEAIKTFDDEPLILEGISLSKSSNGKLFIDGELAASAVFQALYRRDIYADLPALLHVLETRDEETFREYVNVLSYNIDHTFGRGMSLTINCRSGFREIPNGPTPPFETDAQMNRWMQALHFYDGCKEYFRGDPDPSAQAFSTDIPILLVAGTVDPITPPYYADYAKPGLKNHTYVEFPNAGHGGLFSSDGNCGVQILIDFVRAPGSEIDVSCAAKTTVPDFLVSLRQTKAPYYFGTRLQAGQYPYLSIVAAIALILVIIGFPVGWVARQIDGAQTVSLNNGRRAAWLGAILTLIGVYWAITTILGMASSNPASLPVGVPHAVSVGGWMVLAGAIGTLFAVYRLFTGVDGRPPIGTSIAIIGAAISALILFYFTWSVGAGPF